MCKFNDALIRMELNKLLSGDRLSFTTINNLAKLKGVQIRDHEFYSGVLMLNCTKYTEMDEDIINGIKKFLNDCFELDPVDLLPNDLIEFKK